MRRGISAPLLLKGKAMFKIARAALGVSLLALVSSSALAADKITIGIVNAVSDGTLFIAQEKGYLKAEGIDADFVEFDTGAKMVAPMGAGQLDVGGGAASAGLYNAVDRGIRIKIVADKATNVKGAPFQSFMVRKALIDSGEVKTLADLKGRKVAITGAGGSDASVLNEAMRSVGLTYNDVEKIYLGFPQHAPAFQNGAIVGSITTEPTTTNIQRLGAAVVLTGNDAFYPNAQTATIMFSGDFAEKRRDVAVRFMKAYLRAARDFNDALVNGKLQGPGGDELVAILAKYTVIKNPEVLRNMVMAGVNPNGAVNEDSMKKDLAFFKAVGDVTSTKVGVEQVLDQSFAAEAVKVLGPYVKK
jgi:NitT/TauT family transport system substrate-binding protein